MNPASDDDSKRVDPFQTQLHGTNSGDPASPRDTTDADLSRSAKDAYESVAGPLRTEVAGAPSDATQHKRATQQHSEQLNFRHEDSSVSVPALVGRYFIVEPLGIGGMGQVFLAEQREPVKRSVALKLIKAGMDSGEVLKRFDAERQALALMDHPSIAKILDAGDTVDGRPYFAMELVRGLPLTEYCDKHKLNLRQRLDLFVQVCDAVQHAHQKGVLHRDLKPSNILVTEFDGQPIPKVIDFGLAKALQAGPGLIEEGVTTKIGQVVGTLKYMSPEQADLDELDIDTRTDIYALGVILYEILTGTTPLEDASLKGRALVKLLEIVRTNEPVKPSSRLISSFQGKTGQDLTTSREISNKVVEARNTDIRRLKQVLIGDLDWITMKAIENDRRRRYQTASGFAEDVRRFLADQPVLARPPSFAYWLNKSIRRHKAVAATLLLVAACLGVALLSLVYGFNRSRTLASYERSIRVLSERRLAFEQAFLPKKYQLQDFTSSDVELLIPLISQIAEVDRQIAETAQEDLLRTFAMAIESRIEDRQATQADLEFAGNELLQLQKFIAASANGLTGLVTDVKEALLKRKTDWQIVYQADLAPAAKSMTLQKSMQASSATRLRFSLDQESLETLSFLELSLHETDEAGYHFRVSTPEPTVQQQSSLMKFFAGNRETPAIPTKTFAEAMRENLDLTFSISRGSEVLVMQMAPLPTTESWRIIAEVDTARLLFEVNDQLISTRDLFATNAEGTSIGIEGSAQVSLKSLQLEVKPRPQRTTAIEAADFHYIANELVDAASIYSQTESLEAKFKLGLCRLKQADLSRAHKVFSDIFEQPKPPSDDEAIWHLLSGMWLYILDLQTRNYEGKREVLNRLVSSYPGSLNQYLPLVPLQLKKRLLADVRKDGPRWTTALQTDTDLLQLRFAVNMDPNSIDITPRRLRGTRWRLADSLRAAERLAEAEEILLDLVESTKVAPDASVRERIALIADLTWLYLRQDKVLEASRFLVSQADLDAPDLPIAYAPLLTEQARIDLARGELSLAKSRMDRFFELIQPVNEESGTASKDTALSEIPHAAFSDACLVAGLIANDQGQEDAARQYWLKGLRKNWPFWTRDKNDAFGYGHQLVDFQASLTNEAILHSLTGGSRPVDLEEGLRAELGGKRGGRDDIFMLTQALGYAAEKISPVVEKMFDIPDVGERWRREMITRKVSFKSYFIRPIPLLIYRFVRVVFLQSTDVSPEIEKEGFAVCVELVDLHDQGLLNVEEDFSIIVNFINDPTASNALDTIVQRYPPQVAGGLAYLGFKRMQRLGPNDSKDWGAFIRALKELKGTPASMAMEIQSYSLLED